MPDETIDFIAEESKNLDTTCYRGSAPLCLLARISGADVFDQVLNPDGLQRDLSRKHAAEAYEYAARPADKDFPRAFPEIVLNVRDRAVVKLTRLTREDGVSLVRLTFDPDKIERARSVKVSRVDGNHRLFYANGDNNGREALTAVAPYQIHLGLTREQERNLFLDINASQKGLNTSHLAVQRSMLTPEDVELAEHPQRAFARRLIGDAMSPWVGLVNLGGSKKGIREQEGVASLPVNFIALEHGIRRILTKSQYIHDLTTPDAQYAMVRNYWRAVQAVYTEAWEAPREYLLLKNIGIMAFSILGATVVDRCMASGHVEVLDMVELVEHTTDVFDWHRDATGARSVSGMSGNRAALIIAAELASALPPLTEQGQTLTSAILSGEMAPTEVEN